MFASVKGKQEQQVRELQCQEQCIDHFLYFLSELSLSHFFRRTFLQIAVYYLWTFALPHLNDWLFQCLFSKVSHRTTILTLPRCQAGISNQGTTCLARENSPHFAKQPLPSSKRAPKFHTDVTCDQAFFFFFFSRADEARGTVRDIKG